MQSEKVHIAPKMVLWRYAEWNSTRGTLNCPLTLRRLNSAQCLQNIAVTLGVRKRRPFALAMVVLCQALHVHGVFHLQLSPCSWKFLDVIHHRQFCFVFFFKDVLLFVKHSCSWRVLLLVVESTKINVRCFSVEKALEFKNQYWVWLFMKLTIDFLWQKSNAAAYWHT